MTQVSARRDQPRDVSLVIRHGYVLTMDDELTRWPDGAVAVEGGRIVAIGPDADVAAAFRGATTIDAGGAPVHPGLIESHLHASYHLFRGALPDQLSEDDAFNTFEGAFYNAVDDEDEHSSVLLAALEMIRNGTTCFLEAGTVLEPEAAASACSAVGIRAVLGDPFIWDQPNGFAQGSQSLGRGTARPTIRRMPSDESSVADRLGRQLRRNRDPDALVTGHVAVLGLGTASTSLLVAAAGAAREAGAVLNFHQSYSPADTAADRERFGADPIVGLAELGVLGPMSTLAHVNHLTDEECSRLIATGTNVAWAPAASMMWGHGSCLHGRHAELYRRGGRVALGSDSPNWSNSFDLFRQINLAVMTAREAHRDREYLVAEDGLTMATRHGAAAVGMSQDLGVIAPGRRADIVIHSLDRPELVPLTDPVRNLVYSSGSKSVSTVIVDGHVVLRDGEFVALDERRILAEARRRSTALLDRIGYPVPPNDLANRRPPP